MTTCLSNDHGSVASTRSASVSSSNTKRRIWSPASLILKSFHALQSGLKVLPTASILRALLVINFAASTYPRLIGCFDFLRLSLTSSVIVSESFFQSFRTSSMVQFGHKWIVGKQKYLYKKTKVFPHPNEKKRPQALLIILLLEGAEYHS